jgi:hypothetical protein
LSTFHIYSNIPAAQEYMYILYMYMYAEIVWFLSWYDIPELAFPIIEGCCYQRRYWTKGSLCSGEVLTLKALRLRWSSWHYWQLIVIAYILHPCVANYHAHMPFIAINLSLPCLLMTYYWICLPFIQTPEFTPSFYWGFYCSIFSFLCTCTTQCFVDHWSFCSFSLGHSVSVVIFTSNVGDHDVNH